ncbi:MAG: LOG family protein [Acidimicrobiia bacterium]|nr:LOG family protein [Acidimicrobiia bacterium]
MDKLPRYRTGLAAIDRQIADLVDALGPTANAELIFELIASSVRLARDNAGRGDLKIASAALKEMRYAFHVFEPYRSARKVAIFGSARTQREDPLYDQTRDFARRMSELDWMAITGAGPGIMEAGIEGAGPDQSFGVGIRLPFEAENTQFLADDPKLINFRFFFTRKLTFVKEADAFCLLPGGFGTMDEAFELLTLIQTGKSTSAPIVLLDVPHGHYWETWRDFVTDELEKQSYVGPDDLSLVRITDNCDEAVEEISHFYSNYHSQRFVGARLILRMERAPGDADLAALSKDFGDIIERGEIERIEATDQERRDDDHVGLDRIAFRFDRHHWARLRQMIDTLNA